MQYRAGKRGHIEMVYPVGKRLPKEHFTISAYIHAVGLHFQVGRYLYELLDHENVSVVNVWKDEIIVRQIECDEQNNLFNSTSGEQYFYELGVQSLRN